MRRREFIAVLGGAAVAWPLAAHAQPDGRVRRVGVLLNGAESDPTYQAWLAALRQHLQQSGWTEGRNLRLEVRFNAGDIRRTQSNAQELVSLTPEAIVANGAAATRALQERTRAIPIVFVSVGDPVASRVVGSIAHPEGNTTGITNLFPSIAGKWVELLKEAAPHVTRAAFIFNPEFPVTEIYIAAMEAAAAALAVKAIRIPIRSTTEIEHAVKAFIGEPNGGLIMVPPPLIDTNRGLIFRLARQHRLAAISHDKTDAAADGLLSYGPDIADLYRRAASYIDRILRGAKTGELPVQFPTKFELVINLKTAAAIGPTIPDSLLFRADEVIR